MVTQQQIAGYLILIGVALFVIVLAAIVSYARSEERANNIRQTAISRQDTDFWRVLGELITIFVAFWFLPWYVAIVLLLIVGYTIL